jgi:hypothetical protein
MNIKEGDWVYMQDGRVRRPSLVESDLASRHVTLEDFFEIIGCPIPEGARLIIRHDHTGVGLYGAATHCAWRAFEDGWASTHGIYFPNYCLRRTPLSDAWEALPEWAREKFLEVVNGN